MKTIIALSILLCAIAYPTFSEQPQNSVETDIAVIKTEIKNLKEAMEKGFDNMNQKIDKGFDNVQTQFDNVQTQFDTVQTQLGNVQKNFDRQNNIIIACIGISMAILAIGATVWGILTHRRSRKEDMLQNQIEILTQEIETLKKQRIVS